MLGFLARFDRMLMLTACIAGTGALLVIAFGIAEAFNDPPMSGVSSVQSVEAYQDRARWFQAMQDIGQAGIAIALPLAILTFALAMLRPSGSGEDRSAPSAPAVARAPKRGV
ncbi:MAG: hypothetical protein AABY18_09500 [Candidatus Thermoplasmatota archaeon]